MKKDIEKAIEDLNSALKLIQEHELELSKVTHYINIAWVEAILSEALYLTKEIIKDITIHNAKMN